MVQEFDLGPVRGPQGAAGSGDMSAAVYDPNNKAQDMFAYADGYKAAAVGVVLGISDWNVTSKQASLTVSGVKGSPQESKVLLAPKATATAAQREAWRKAMVYPVAQAANTVVIGADGALPAVEIPLLVYIWA